MDSKVLKKIIFRLNFWYRQSRYLTAAFRRLLCKSITVPQFDYGSSSWFPILKKKLKIKLQNFLRKCIYFCLYLHSISFNNLSHFKKINQLPANHKEQYGKRKICFKENFLLSLKIELNLNKYRIIMIDIIFNFVIVTLLFLSSITSF